MCFLCFSFNVSCSVIVCENNAPFARAFALPSGSRDCSPAPDLVFLKLMFPHVFFSGGVFFTDTGPRGPEGVSLGWGFKVHRCCLHKSNTKVLPRSSPAIGGILRVFRKGGFKVHRCSLYKSNAKVFPRGSLKRTCISTLRRRHVKLPSAIPTAARIQSKAGKTDDNDKMHDFMI